MADPPKKATDRGVVDSIAALRLLRYMTKGAGAKPSKAAPVKPSIEKLRSEIAKVPAKKPKKAKRKIRR